MQDQSDVFEYAKSCYIPTLIEGDEASHRYHNGGREFIEQVLQVIVCKEFIFDLL
jgi:hypothetical protein